MISDGDAEEVFGTREDSLEGVIKTWNQGSEHDERYYQ